MTRDLFAQDPALRQLSIRDAEVLYLGALALPKPAALILGELIDSVPWRAEHIVIWGRSRPQPRLTAWFGDPGTEYSYSGLRLTPIPWTPLLQTIRQEVESVAGVGFNSVLANYYRDQNDGMGFHSDDEPELGPQPVIASVSLGERRTFVLKHRTRRDLPPVRLPLDSGSLLLMRGATQHHWKHGIGKLTRPCGPRVNLTFRRIG